MLDGLDERRPCPGSEAECGAGLVLRVADGHDARSVAGHFDAITAVTAEAGLAPAKIVYVFHFSSATFNTISRDCACGAACCRIRSKATAAARTSDRDSVVCPSGTASVCSTSAVPSTLARLMLPDSPAVAPTAVGTT